MTSVVGTGTRRRAVVDGTFGRSMLAAASRGLGLVGVAVLVGVLLLQLTEDTAAPPPGAVGAVDRAPTTTTTIGEFDDIDAPLRPPSQIQILVLNAARVQGAAGEVTETLQTLGYPTLPPGNAPTEDSTIVFYKPGFEREASIIADEVGDFARAEPLQDPSPYAGTEDADVVVVLGTDIGPPT